MSTNSRLRGDAVQPRLDGGVADAEHLLHLLDRAVALHEGGDEDLVFGGQPRQLRQLEGALDGDVLAPPAAPARPRTADRR